MLWVETNDEVPRNFWTTDGKGAGTLVTGQWVLTANTCVACNRLPNEVLVQYGNQLRRVERLARYPTGDCVHGQPVDSHDVMFMRLNGPLTTDLGVNTPAWWNAAEHRGYEFAPFVAFGWDMSPATAWNHVPIAQQCALPSLGIDSNVVFNGASLGDQIWVGPAVSESGQVALPTVNDLGAGSWASVKGSQYYVGVSAWYPRIPRSYAVGSNREARYTSIIQMPATYDFFGTR